MPMPDILTQLGIEYDRLSREMVDLQARLTNATLRREAVSRDMAKIQPLVEEEIQNELASRTSPSPTPGSN